MSIPCPNCQFEKTTISGNFLQCSNCNETLEKLTDGGWSVCSERPKHEPQENPIPEIPAIEIPAEPLPVIQPETVEALPVKKNNNLIFGSLLVVGISLIFLGKFLCLIKKKQFSKAPLQEL